MSGIQEIVGFDLDYGTRNFKDCRRTALEPCVTELLQFRRCRRGLPVRRKLASIEARDVYFVESAWNEHIRRQHAGVDVNEHLECCKRSSLSHIHNWQTRRIPSTTFDRGALAVESRRCVLGLCNTPSSDHLREDAVLEAPDQSLNFARSDVSLCQCERHRPTKAPLRC